jgi:tetratricopeptide (TPR) repeat protein
MRNEKLNTKIILLFSLFSLHFSLFSCSTPPKNPGNIYTMRRQAESQLNLGNKQADRGDLENALVLLNEALRIAVAADDPGLRIRARLSYSNVLFLSGRGDEAMAGWNRALLEAEQLGKSELTAVCRIHIERGKLLSPGGKSVAQSVRDAVNRDLGLIKKDRFYIAFAWTVIGHAEKELGRYRDAEAAVRRSLEIHEKDGYFELAAYDWFMIASFRSLAADYRGARQALENAITFDRRVENSWGLASDWRALGDVHAKAGDRAAARGAWQRAAEIYRALGNEEIAEQILSKIE